MCGRFTQRVPAARLRREFKLKELPHVEVRYNIAPTQNILAVRQAADEREAVYLKWGLIPSWTKDSSIGSRLINARSETLLEKPAFRTAFKRRRCLIPADGFYEWGAVSGGRKQPFYFSLTDEQPFAFAGLWEHWRNADDEEIETCTILTTQANDAVSAIGHDRMPVILPARYYDLWLGSDVSDQEQLLSLLQPYPADEMLSYPVGWYVNNPAHDDERCLAAIGD